MTPILQQYAVITVASNIYCLDSWNHTVSIEDRVHGCLQVELYKLDNSSNITFQMGEIKCVMKRIGLKYVAVVIITLATVTLMLRRDYKTAEGAAVSEVRYRKFSGISTGYDESIRSRFNKMTNGKAESRDLDLVEVARDMILRPDRSTNVLKIHRKRVVETPQEQAVQDILQKKKRGFFLECGAFDGETSSNTLILEQKLGWSGLLVEMDPYFYTQLRGKNRRAYSINACLSPNQWASQLEYKESAGQLGKLHLDRLNSTNTSAVSTKRSVPCLPVETLILAMNRTSVDYFSLDVEGLEYEVIQTIPFDRLNIRVISVEHKHVSVGKEVLRDYIEKQGYTLYKDMHHAKPQDLIFVEDFIFVKNSLWKTIPSSLKSTQKPKTKV